MSKVRRFAQQRLAERNGKDDGGMSLREVEDLFVNKLLEKCKLKVYWCV